MADRYPGQIEIGGTITINTVEERELVEIALGLFETTTQRDFDGSDWESMTFEDVADEVEESGYLCGCDHQARYGMFEELEEACRNAGIGYRRHSSAKYEYDAEIVEWRPGMESPVVFLSDDDRKINILGSIAREAIGLIENGNPNDAVNLLKNHLGDNIPPLEPLKIIDNAPADPED